MGYQQKEEKRDIQGSNRQGKQTKTALENRCLYFSKGLRIGLFDVYYSVEGMVHPKVKVLSSFDVLMSFQTSDFYSSVNHKHILSG